MLNLQKLAQIVQNLFLNRDSGFYIVKITVIDYQVKKISLILVFGDKSFLKICWAA